MMVPTCLEALHGSVSQSAELSAATDRPPRSISLSLASPPPSPPHVFHSLTACLSVCQG